MVNTSKVIFTTAIAAFAAAAYAQTYYTLTGENNEFTSEIPAATITNYDGFNGEMFVFQVGESVTSGAGTFNVGTFGKDFVFDSGVKLSTPPKTLTTVTLNDKFIINNGATVTINTGLVYNVKAKTRLWIDNDSGTWGTVVLNAPVTRLAKNTDGSNNTSLNNCEFFIRRGNMVLNANIDSGYTSLYGGGSVTVNVDSSTTTFAIRASATLYTKELPTAVQEAVAGKSGVRDSGLIVLNGASYNIKACALNSIGDEPTAGSYGHIFTVRFGQVDAAENFKCEAMKTYLVNAANGSPKMDGFLFEDMAAGDAIYTDANLSNYASQVYVNGSSIADLISDGTLEVSSDSTYNYIYTYAAIPEPAEFAALFGALALGFAFLRRRK